MIHYILFPFISNFACIYNQKQLQIYMKKVWFILLILLNLISSVFSNNYGLHFKSHSVAGSQRTSLLLNDLKPFTLKNEFTLSFDLTLREEPPFGNIFSIQTSDGQTIDVIFTTEDKKKYVPAIVINGAINLLETPIDTSDTSFATTLSKKENKIILTYNKKSISFPIHLEKTKDINLIFGVSTARDRLDVAPINIHDIRIFENKRNTYHWELKQHNGNICYDLVQQAPAVAINPHWIINDHIEWKSLYSIKTEEKIQIAFNPTKNVFYLVQQNLIHSFNPETNDTQTIEIKHGHRAMMYSNYLEYDTLTNELLSYSIENNLISRFDFQKQSWSLTEENTDEPAYANHTWAVSDSMAYTFGGYGFYHFKNSLFCLDPKRNTIAECQYTPSITPRTSSASAIVGDELYIFGGRGNSSGRQELPAQYYYDLYAINLKTMKSRKIWEKNNVEIPFIQATTMYFVPEDSSFYAATTEHGGILIKLSLKEPTWEYVSKAINAKLSYKDIVFNLYQAPNHEKMYLVIDKRLNDENLNHDLTIYSIDCPLLENNQTEQILVTPWYHHKALLPSLILVLIIFVFLIGLNIFKKRISHKVQLPKAKQNLDIERPMPMEVITEKKYFDRSKSSISLLGGFNVKDKSGKDITADFTPRAKSLLIILLLYSEKYPQGILVKKLDDIIWADKDEESARNNRNVYMRKLRLLLESIGHIEVANDKSYFRINIDNEVFFDYHVALTHIAQIENKESNDSELIDKILELLLYGALLPNTTYDWLDDFKENYSSTSITLLTNLLSRELNKGNDNAALRIADTIFLHDPLNEEALSAKCSILYNQRMKGIAKNVYDKFCKEYNESLGEKYKVSFTDICNKKLPL